ncbi:MAG: hypothetical protein HC915_17960, partial [Anaerolineae bacterium]|nr:hypothetical protein [Anaerolineae bacterium]
MNARLRPNHVAATIANTATVTVAGRPPVSDTDVNGVIYDPPLGEKVGVVVDG